MVMFQAQFSEKLRRKQLYSRLYSKSAKLRQYDDTIQQNLSIAYTDRVSSKHRPTH